ncbi:hypothetical protein ACFL35_16490, partial [Candidatus Riflebacteria bacterium]
MSKQLSRQFNLKDNFLLLTAFFILLLNKHLQGYLLHTFLFDILIVTTAVMSLSFLGKFVANFSGITNSINSLAFHFYFTLGFYFFILVAFSFFLTGIPLLIFFPSIFLIAIFYAIKLDKKSSAHPDLKIFENSAFEPFIIPLTLLLLLFYVNPGGFNPLIYYPDVVTALDNHPRGMEFFFLPFAFLKLKYAVPLISIYFLFFSCILGTRFFSNKNKTIPFFTFFILVAPETLQTFFLPQPFFPCLYFILLTLLLFLKKIEPHQKINFYCLLAVVLALLYPYYCFIPLFFLLFDGCKTLKLFNFLLIVTFLLAPFLLWTFWNSGQFYFCQSQILNFK